MQKFFIILLIIIGFLFITILVCRFTGAVDYHSIVTPSNEPTLREGSLIFSSVFKKPKRFDFILYKHVADHYYETATWVHRLCGLPGDKIQVINGELFVNDQATVSLFNTYHNYSIANDDLERLNKQENIAENRTIMQLSKDSLVIALDIATINKYELQARPYFIEDTNGEIFHIYHQHWTADNFGPLFVPNDSYFVLGDNRGNSLDSRYAGCIKKENLVATVIGSK
ncbi:MAG: signal peptidase I [Ferruginibacter sp.]